MIDVVLRQIKRSSGHLEPPGFEGVSRTVG